jgi:hypothetical protein
MDDSESDLRNTGVKKRRTRAVDKKKWASLEMAANDNLEVL